MAKYVIRPVVIEAEQFFIHHSKYPDGVVYDMYDYPDGCQRPGNFRIETLEGWMQVDNGDWIITGDAGEKYPCKPDIFAQTYDPVETLATT